ncbi:MAG: PEP-CTERM sorting domain-containing protein [Cyanobacteria bacterium P01_D01_bin.115]
MNINKIAILPGLVAGAAVTMSVAPAHAVSFTVTGHECPTALCTDLASAGYTVDEGLVTSGSIKNSTLTPGTDDKTSVDSVDDSSSVVSYNVASIGTQPVGVTNLIEVSGLDGMFEFFWGSVDTFNVIEFFDGGVSVGIFDGTDIAEAVGLSTSDANAQGNYHFDAFVNFAGVFDSVKLSNQVTGDASKETLIAFEVAAASVPEPASLLGLAAFGLVSAGSLMNRKKQSA